MNDGKKTKKELLSELAELRQRLAAVEQDHQIIVDGLREKHQVDEAQWRQRVEDLESRLGVYPAVDQPPLSGVEAGTSEWERLLARVQEQTEELQAANEELNVQTEELQAANEELTIQTEELRVANEELTIQTEELRVANEELTALNDLLEMQKQELQRLARELETEHAMLTAVLEQMPASVVIVKAPAGPILMSNKHAAYLFRQPPGRPTDLESFWRIERYTPDGGVREKEDHPLWRSLTMGEVVLDEELSLHPEGRPPIHLSVSSAPVRDHQGKIVAGVVTHFDITARKRAEETLRASEARYRNLVHLSPDAIIVHTEGKIVSLNLAAVLLLRASRPADILGRHILDLVHPDSRKLGKRRLKMAQAGGTIAPQEIQLVRLDGTAVDVETVGSGIMYQGQPAVQVIIRDVTVRKQAAAERERLLAERDRTATQLEAVLNSMSEGLIIADPEGNILAMNHAALALWGFKSVAEVKRHLSEFSKIMDVRELSGEVVPWEEWPMARALRGETFANWELRLRRQDHGEEFICSYSGGPVLDKSGRTILGVVTIQNATERKRAEVAIIQAKEEWERTFDAVPDSIAILDQEHRITRINRAMAELLGVDHEAVIGQPCYKAVHGLEAVPDFCPHARLMANGEAYAIEVQEFGRIFAVSVSPIFGPDGQITGGVHVARDITESKQAEEALRASEERERARARELQEVLDAVPAFIWLAHDPDYRVVTGNRAAYELLRLPPGANLSKVTPEGEVPLHFRVMQGNREIPYQELPVHRAARGQSVQNDELDVVMDDGTIYNVLGNAVPLLDHAGKIRGAVAAFIDVTARKQAEEDLQRAHDELELRVLERTTELRDTVAQLLEEVQERQLAQEALRKQAELLELAHEAIIVRDLDSRVIFWNRGAEDKYGWTREEALGRVSHELLGTRFPTSWEEVNRALVETGHWEGEVVHTRANGEEIIISSRQAVQRDEQGQPVAILEMNRNVTARRRVQEALKTERQRLLLLLERIPAYVSLLKADQTFAYVNAEFIRRFGEPGNKHCYELKGLQNPCEECEAKAVFHSGKPLVRERVGHDGSFYQVHDYPFMDVDGSPLVLEMGVDITPRKQAEEQALNLGRMYHMLSKVNEAVARIGRDKDRLFQQVCRIMMEEGDFLLSWIGLVNWETRLIEAATQYNLDDDYVQNLTIPIDDVPEGRGPAGTAIREDRVDICNDYVNDPRMAPWLEPALARGFRSSGAFPLRVGSQVVGLMNVYADRPGFFNTAEIDLLESLTEDLSFALDFMDKDARRRRAEAALRESEERLRYLASQLLHTQENERRRLALELHDDLGQSLMVLKLQLRAIERTVPQDQWQFREECTHCLNYLNGVIDNVRRLSRDLRPAVLEDLGLSSGLRLLAGDFCEYHEVELSLEIDDIEGLFSPDEEINIYRIFQETLTNIAKHAAAQQIVLVVSRHNNVVNFLVKDNGVGFDLEQVLARDPTKKGLGLVALEERVHMLGGTLTIKSQKHQGTEISFSVPISGKSEA